MRICDVRSVTPERTRYPAESYHPVLRIDGWTLAGMVEFSVMKNDIGGMMNRIVSVDMGIETAKHLAEAILQAVKVIEKEGGFVPLQPEGEE